MHFDSGLLPKKPLQFRAQNADKQQSLMFFSLLAFGFALALLSLAGGFIYGDYYGRQHAQYDNPKLRDYYAGQCYTFVENQFRKTMRASIEKHGSAQAQKLEDIKSILLGIQANIGDITPPKPHKDGRKKMASAQH